jgi:hypothetical protein
MKLQLINHYLQKFDTLRSVPVVNIEALSNLNDEVYTIIKYQKKENVFTDILNHISLDINGEIERACECSNNQVISNSILEDVAYEYNINPKALRGYAKEYFKETGLKLKDASRLQLLEVVFINAPDLMYCRADEIKDTVEYLNHSINKKLVLELKELREVAL